MTVITDTCAILMLIRICPNMFTDTRYGCVMLQESYVEYAKQARFKRQYPWREECRGFLSSQTQSQLNAVGFPATLQAVRAAASMLQDAEGFGKYYIDELSETDLRMAAATLSFEAELCTGDGALMRFAGQELELSVVQPLAVINGWLEQGLMTWDDEKQEFLKDWVRERHQPWPDIDRFEALTGYTYPAK